MAKKKPTMDEVIQKYRKGRAILDREEAAFKKRMRPLRDAMEKMENYMLAYFKEEGGTSFAGDHGTAFTKRRRTIKTNDWGMFLKYVQKNKAWVMLNKSPNKTSIIEQMEDTGEIPPGVEVSTELVVQVNKPTGAK